MFVEYQAFTYEAYAPRPMVLDMILKGRSLGSGSSCDCDIVQLGGPSLRII
jgi:hypothetical protein